MTGHSSLYAFLAGAVLLGSIWQTVEIKSKNMAIKLSEIEQLQKQLRSNLKIMAMHTDRLQTYNNSLAKNNLAIRNGMKFYALGSGSDARFVKELFSTTSELKFKPITAGTAVHAGYQVESVNSKEIKLRPISMTGKNIDLDSLTAIQPVIERLFKGSGAKVIFNLLETPKSNAP